jgi:hypothetical protein
MPNKAWVLDSRVQNWASGNLISVTAPIWNYYEFSVAVDYELFFVGCKTTHVGACDGKEKVESKGEVCLP